MSPKLSAVPTTKPRAVLYVRVSTKEQLQGDGDPDGYSIPAQRDACEKRALALGAEVAEVFVERGESARSADRPALQQMLRYLVSESIDYVIVHKVDRLARNRLDDVQITAAIQTSGAQLVSVTENIDETPSGTLMHGIMSSIAEFYSRNLANEVIKGTQQKVSAGGTPHVAPLGYLNVRRFNAGQETRTIEIDSERAELVKWAFETYAGGEYSLRQLATELAERGLSQRPTPKRAARPLPANKLHDMLRNRYYIGFVTWRGVEHQGKHPVLVSAETFEQVQRVLAAHRVAGERSYRQQHYLTGTLRCGRCQSRLLFVVTRGRRGDLYEYFYCAGRHSGRTDCRLPHIPVAQLEQVIEGQWQQEAFSPEVAASIRQEVLASLGDFEAGRQQERDRLETRQQAIRRERYKWSDLAMQGAVPADIAREKQQQLADQLLSTEAALERLSRAHEGQRAGISALLELLDRCGDAYLRSDEKGRRDYNQAWFDSLDIDVDGDEQPGPSVKDVHRTEPLEALQAYRSGPSTRPTTPTTQNSQDLSPGCSDLADAALVDVSNFSLLVELRGLEPLTPTLPVWCATSCATAPLPRCAGRGSPYRPSGPGVGRGSPSSWRSSRHPRRASTSIDQRVLPSGASQSEVGIPSRVATAARAVPPCVTASRVPPAGTSARSSVTHAAARSPACA
ncbi:MAG: hypothetical protein JWM64_1928 [Frankiales bacterium]|nr:hypothetical protein [Frankiales bacterium]